MSDVAIRVEGLGKRFALGGPRPSYRSLRESMMSAAAVVLRRRRRRRGELIWALEDINFEVKQGEVLGIVGRNGAGKSTLLKILSRISEPTVGQISLHGRVGSLLEVGTGFHPELTGRENIYLYGAILGMRKGEITAKFDEIVAFSEVERFLDTPVKHYSSGMYMRLAFSVAAHLEPEILLVDEVLAVGDTMFQAKCLGKMKDVSETGRTVLFVSHNMSAVFRLCTRALLLDGGRIADDGVPERVVAGYLGGIRAHGSGRTWDTLAAAPGTRELRLLGVDVVDAAEEKSTVVVNITHPVCIKVRYHVGVPNLKFRCTVILHKEGGVAFATIEPFETVRERVGTYESVVSIPANLLNEGDYTVNVSAFASRGVKMWFFTEAAVAAFQVFDSMSGDSARGDYAESFGGPVRPKLPWAAVYLGDDVQAP